MQGQKQRSRLTPLNVLFLVVLLVLAIAVVRLLPDPNRRLAFSTVCGANLAHLGQAMKTYASDHDGNLPQAGGPNAVWAARTPNWKASSREEAYGTMGSGAPGRASVSASLYLLVPYADAPLWTFTCPADAKTRKFIPADYGVQVPVSNLYDFGPEPPRHVSYSYHAPYNQYRLTRARPASAPVAADRNPWMGSPFAKARDFSRFKPNRSPYAGTIEDARNGNSLAHGGDGQLIVFLDGHVEYFKESFWWGKESTDNLYTSWDGADKMRGTPPVLGSVPADPNDALLVNDPAGPTP